MTRVRRINVSQIEGDDANNTEIDEIRPFGEAAFYIDESGPGDKLTMMMFDGERTHLKSKVLAAGVVYGSNADSGDGLNYDTIKLIPDAELHRDDGSYNNDQYLIIDPTIGDPINHIHIRAGGDIDQSRTDLFLGGEKNNLRVSDVNDQISITTDANFDNVTHTWTFGPNGDLTFPGSSNAKIGEEEPGLVVRSDIGFAVLTNANTEDSKSWIFDNAGNLNAPGNVTANNLYITEMTFPDDSVQTVAYAGGVGREIMIDTNRTDSYEEVGSTDRPFKTFAAAIAAAETSADTAFTFVLMGCTITENVDFTGTTFTQITISTASRSVISGNVTISNVSSLSQLFVRNIEVGGTFTLTGDGTSEQMNSCNFYNVSFSGAVNITATNATAFYGVSFFNVVNFTNLSYLYINGAQFIEDWTITADSTGVIPSRGINPGTGGSIAIIFNIIANNVIFVKGGTAAYVFQPHMSRMGVSSGTYTIPAGWTMTPHSTVLRGTWVNNGSLALRNTSHDNLIGGTAPSYVGSIGATSLKFQDATTQTTAYAPVTGSWTLTPGVNTVSFTVDWNHTYTMWLRGNIPNGIAVWNATVTVTNSNVPVVGTQYGWYYVDGGELVLTAIPAQIVGTAGSISTAAPAVGTTANTFVFNITNNTAESQTVYYGYTKV